MEVWVWVWRQTQTRNPKKLKLNRLRTINNTAIIANHIWFIFQNLSESTPDTESNEPIQPSEISTTSLTLGSYLPSAIKASPLASPQNPLNQFKENGFDRPISPQAQLNLSTVPNVPSFDTNANKSSQMLTSLDLFTGQDQSTSEIYLPLKAYAIENLFSTDNNLSGEPHTIGESSHIRKSSDYFSLTNMTSSLDEINASCLLPRLSVSSTSASLLTMPSTTITPISDSLVNCEQTVSPMPPEKLAVVSPAKKPVGAERVSARNSLISPNDIMHVANDLNNKPEMGNAFKSAFKKFIN